MLLRVVKGYRAVDTVVGMSRVVKGYKAVDTVVGMSVGSNNIITCFALIQSLTLYS